MAKLVTEDPRGAVRRAKEEPVDGRGETRLEPVVFAGFMAEEESGAETAAAAGEAVMLPLGPGEEGVVVAE